MDFANYGWRALYGQRAIWAVIVFRLGHAVRDAPMPLGALRTAHSLLQLLTQAFTNVEIHRDARIGPGLNIIHGGNVVINSSSRVGERCTMRQGVTIGVRRRGGPSPVVGDDVEIGAYCQVLGDITIGNRAILGAMSVVLCDVPAGATAVGNPARILSPED
jgi:serine O-acetyltransferase